MAVGDIKVHPRTKVALSFSTGKRNLKDQVVYYELFQENKAVVM